MLHQEETKLQHQNQMEHRLLTVDTACSSHNLFNSKTPQPNRHYTELQIHTKRYWYQNVIYKLKILDIFQWFLHISIIVKDFIGEIQFGVVKPSCVRGFYLSRKRKQFIEVLCQPNLLPTVRFSNPCCLWCVKCAAQCSEKCHKKLECQWQKLVRCGGCVSVHEFIWQPLT